MFGVIFKQIEQTVLTKLNFQKILKVHKLAMLPEFKQYKKWLKPEDI